ncbi:hypothetical protein CPLU01_06226 [Colletotrichum plurivorum]|uniref:Uncharacterized protein n=1 Tax=Colletotrichum plurivorum TaxID=2175906 RepID=A0A8H6KJU7_9PEZI|nr:hypothetical protein CPLU01_06226 [Colletotrichum plurivorum]
MIHLRARAGGTLPWKPGQWRKGACQLPPFPPVNESSRSGRGMVGAPAQPSEPVWTNNDIMLPRTFTSALSCRASPDDFPIQSSSAGLESELECDCHLQGKGREGQGTARAGPGLKATPCLAGAVPACACVVSACCGLGLRPRRGLMAKKTGNSSCSCWAHGTRTGVSKARERDKKRHNFRPQFDDDGNSKAARTAVPVPCFGSDDQRGREATASIQIRHFQPEYGYNVKRFGRREDKKVTADAFLGASGFWTLARGVLLRLASQHLVAYFVGGIGRRIQPAHPTWSGAASAAGGWMDARQQSCRPVALPGCFDMAPWPQYLAWDEYVEKVVLVMVVAGRKVLATSVANDSSLANRLVTLNVVSPVASK